MSEPQLTFIGGGNMATSIIGGLIAQRFPANAITACDPLEENLQKLKDNFNISTSTDNGQGVANADAVLLAVKPQIMKKVCEQLKPFLKENVVIISIAAGIPVNSISEWIGNHLAIVRCMPNTPALVQQGASGLYANKNTSSQQKDIANKILCAVGIVEWLNEERLLDAVTAISGSGPAYFFLFMESMIEAGIKQGLTADTAKNLAIQTCLGAGLLAQKSDVDVAELRQRVCSPGGTTIEAVNSFETDNIKAIVERAMQACADRAVEMAEELQ
ncbi:MAG: pyrroline-5-carboxylate reductase [Cellvibrionaceae bacterium]